MSKPDPTAGTGEGAGSAAKAEGDPPATTRGIALWKLVVIPLIWILGIGVAAKVGGLAILVAVVISLAGLGYAASVLGVDSRDGKDWPPPP